ARRSGSLEPGLVDDEREARDDLRTRREARRDMARSPGRAREALEVRDRSAVAALAPALRAALAVLQVEHGLDLPAGGALREPAVAAIHASGGGVRRMRLGRVVADRPPLHAC